MYFIAAFAHDQKPRFLTYDSLPCVKGGGPQSGGGIVEECEMSIPQSPLVTAPFAQGSLSEKQDNRKYV